MGCRASRPAPPAPADRAVLQTKLRRDELGARRARLHSRAQLAGQRALELARAGQKEQALYHLSKKRLMLREALAVDGRLALLNQQIAAIERLVEDAEVAAALRQSNEVIRDLMESIDVADLRAAEMDDHNAEVAAVVREAAEDPEVLQEYEALGVELPLAPATQVQSPAQQPRVAASARELALA